jgi:glycine cleavage system protein P-like pyridoxal-binding family
MAAPVAYSANGNNRGSAQMGGTTVIPVASKQTRMAHKSAEAEIDAAFSW